MSRRVTLFGGLQVYRDGARIEVESARVESLVSYLALHRQAPVPRSTLAFLLWPDTTSSQARTNLRKVVHLLRHSFLEVEELLSLTGRTIGWRTDSGWELDVAEFDAHVAADRLAAAAEVYRGDLVPHCQDEWVQPVRTAYRERFLQVLRRLMSLHESAGDVQSAVSTAERILELDPVDEATARLLMRLHDQRGERGKAVRVYHGLASSLRDELDVEPSPETARARDALLVDHDDDGFPGQVPTRAPFVGRTEERRQLVEAWRAAESGWSSVVVVGGEAGIGKSRLVEDFARWCAHEGVAVATATAYAAERVLAYGPVSEWLGTLALRRRRRALGPEHVAELSRLEPALSRTQNVQRAEPPLPEAERRLRLWGAVTAAVVGSGEPLLLVLDDAHWADQESLRLLHHVIRTARDAPILAVLTLRSGQPDEAEVMGEVLRGLRSQDRLTELALAPLSADETTLLARRAGSVTAEAAGHRLWQLTGGNPLFVVEALQAGWPADRFVGSADALTPRVHEVIEERLNRLSASARDLLGVAAVVGTEFDSDIVTAVAGVDAAVPALDELWRQRVIRERGGSTYDFTHEQIRVVAYGQMSHALRRRLHKRTAQAMTNATPGRAPSAARIAYHFDNADAVDDAVAWYVRAAAEAQLLGASHEAIWSLERGRTLLSTAPESDERHRQELVLLTALPAPLASTEGYASERISTVHARAVHLAERAGAELDAPLLWSLAFSSLVKEDFPCAQQYAGQLHQRGVRDGDRRLVVEGACLLGIASFWQNELELAREWFERTVADYHPDDRLHHLATYGQDPRVVACARLGNVQALLGDPAAAHEACRSALRLAEEVRHPLTRAAAYVFAGLLGLDVHDQALVRQAGAALAHPGVDALPIRHVARALTGYVDVLDGDPRAGLALIGDAITDATVAPAAPGMLAMLHRILLAAAVESSDTALAVQTARFLRDSPGSATVWHATADRILLAH